MDENTHKKVTPKEWGYRGGTVSERTLIIRGNEDISDSPLDENLEKILSQIEKTCKNIETEQKTIKVPRIYQVGGSVRDKLLGIPHHDIDYVVECNDFEQMVTYLNDNQYEIFVQKPEFGCVKARREGEKTSEFVICRKDGRYSDSRRPDFIEPSNLITDLSRRDFTINAIAIDSEGNYIDLFNGIDDIKRKLIRCVGDPIDRILEDPLRGIRALRFSITKGFKIDQDIMTIIAHKEYIRVLGSVSKERIQSEINKMFQYNTIESIRLLSRLPIDLLNSIFVKTGLTLKATMKSPVKR